MLLVDELADHRVPERIAFALLDDQAEAGRLLERRGQLEGGPGDHRRQVIDREGRTQQRGRLQNREMLAIEGSQPPAHQLAKTSGQHGPAHQLGDAVGDLNGTVVAKAVDQLGDQQRVATGAQNLLQQARTGLGADHHPHQVHHRGGVERRQLDDRRPRAAGGCHERRQLGGRRRGSEGGEDEKPPGLRPSPQAVERQQGAGVGPVEIVEGDGHRGATRQAVDVGDQAVEEPGTPGLRPGGPIGEPGEGRVAGCVPDAQGVEERLARATRRDQAGAGGEDLAAAAPGLGGALLEQAGLAHAGLPLDEHHLAAPGAGVGDGGAENRQLAVTAQPGLHANPFRGGPGDQLKPPGIRPAYPVAP